MERRGVSVRAGRGGGGRVARLGAGQRPLVEAAAGV